ncbi:MAG: BadF/BadG/BcrA/BcrD ATPase family protein [Paracoccaceae bacterium]
MTFHLGIDGGGTGCRAVVVGPDGAVLGQGNAGPANVATNIAQAVQNILSATAQALGPCGLPAGSENLRVGLGLAGANAAGAEAELAHALPFRHMRVATDAITTALGAMGHDDGILAAVGTGSVFVVQDSGRLRQAGGWGFALGDEGSGARLGQALLSAVLMMADGRMAETPLLRQILAEFGGTGQILRFASRAAPADYAALAPRVTSTTDPGALALQQAAIDTLAAQIDLLQPARPVPVVLTGGLAAFYAARLGGRWPLRPARGTALDGALTLASEAP